MVERLLCSSSQRLLKLSERLFKENLMSYCHDGHESLGLTRKDIRVRNLIRVKRKVDHAP